MPGIVGGVGCDARRYESLHQAFSLAWGSCERVTLDGGFVGGHAFAPHSAVHQGPDGLCFAVDGETSLYTAARDSASGSAPVFFDPRSAEFSSSRAGAGNLALSDPRSGTWSLSADATGSFPLYYAGTDDGLLFSSLLRPLAKALGSSADPLGILEFLRYGYTLAGRSHFSGIRRLLPGQVLTYDPERRQLRLRETSRFWAGLESDHDSPGGGAAEPSWDALGRAVARCGNTEGPVALMMSAGWDSRTLLAAMGDRFPPGSFSAYSHGDLRSRELKLIDALCHASGVALHREPLHDRLYRLDRLQRGFGQVETVLFPHWIRAGEVLGSLGVKTVSAGVFGEILGGHYGRAMRLEGARKVGAVAGALVPSLGRLLAPASDDLASAAEFLRTPPFGKPWYLAPQFWDALSSPAAAVNGDIDEDVSRLRRRGVSTADQLVEAFVSEHRGSQYINAQILSCRGTLDVCLPYADQELLEIASRVPLDAKIHNLLNRDMLRRHAPQLLSAPMAATLTPASAPMLLQEGSRLVRRVAEEGQWKMHFATGARVPAPRLGWCNFEFVRESDAMESIVDDLRSDIWDVPAIRKRTRNVSVEQWRKPLHPLLFQLLSVYTVDLMLR